MRRYDTYLSLVGEDSALQMTITELNTNGRKILEKLKTWDKKGKSSRDERVQYLTYFSHANWKNLADTERKSHTLKACKKCDKTKQLLFTHNCESKQFRTALKDITNNSNIISTPGHCDREQIANQAYNRLRYIDT